MGVATTLCGAAAFQGKTVAMDTQDNESMFTLAEMKQMNEKGKVVVAYQGGLYDVSDFTGHPGGYGRIQMAAGGDLEDHPVLFGNGIAC